MSAKTDLTLRVGRMAESQYRHKADLMRSQARTAIAANAKLLTSLADEYTTAADVIGQLCEALAEHAS